MGVVILTSQDCQENERREGMCRASAWLAVDLHEGMSRHGLAGCLQDRGGEDSLVLRSSRGLRSQEGPALPLPQGQLGLLRTPRLMAVQTLRPCSVVSYVTSRPLRSLLRIQLAQLEGACWAGTSRSSGSDAPPCPGVSFSLGAVLIFHGFHRRQKAESRFLQGESKCWGGEEGGRAAW